MASCVNCDDGRLRIEDFDASDEADYVWRPVVAVLADAWFMAWAEGDRPGCWLNEAETLAYDERGDPFVPDSNRVFHYSTLRLLNDGVFYLVFGIANGQSWKECGEGIDFQFKRSITDRVRDHAVERLIAEEEPARLGLLAADDRPTVREAATLALRRLKEAGQVPGQ